MTPGLLWLLIVWGALTVVLIILLIYRSTLTMQEDDQLFLDDSASAMAKDQMELMAKVNKITPVVKMLGAASGAMILVIAGWAVYLGLNSVSLKEQRRRIIRAGFSGTGSGSGVEAGPTGRREQRGFRYWGSLLSRAPLFSSLWSAGRI